jgi:hypothetical protein
MKSYLKIPARFIPAATAALFLCACATEIIRNPVPLEYQHDAEVVDMPGVRAWGDEPSAEFHNDIVDSIRNEKEGLFPRADDGAFEYAGLSLSGGGDHGAFGAGYLKGWSKSGTRPVFKIVTGISTGALIAPFALLGPGYDDVLERAYTAITAQDIYKERSVISAFWNESLADSHPLQDLVHDVVTDEVIDAVGAAHRNGQRLFIGTTNFDAQRPVIWNMGAVANSIHPEANRIFREILVASAAIPIFFPPVFVEVEANGHTYDEMHVDGGTVGQMFFYGATLDWQEVIRTASGQSDPLDRSILYVIVDGEVDPEPKHIRRRLMPITERTIGTLIKVSAWSALYRMYLHAEHGGYGFRYVGLPEDYESQTKEPYNPDEMKRMFDIGYGMGVKSDSWRSIPPGF